MTESVRIHYLRPPDRRDLFVQELLHRSDDAIVTFMPSTALDRPVRVDEQVILESGSPVIWFTYPGRMHDVGIFHDAAGNFTGYYANLLTPVHFFSELEWETTDLFLDVWLGADGRARLLDQDEFTDAVERGWLAPDLAAAASTEAGRLLERCATGAFPDPEVRAWSLSRTAPLRAG